MIEIALRATPHSKLLLSPYEIVFGRPMPLGIPGEPQPRLSDTKSDKLAYYRWLTTELKRLHAAVKESREEMKRTEKLAYDKAHKAVTPTWKVDDLVLLKDDRVKAGAVKVVTKQRFFGPYVIVVKGRPDLGFAYQLVEANTGCVLRNLVTSDRLKAFNANRENFNKRLPPLMNKQPTNKALNEQKGSKNRSNKLRHTISRTLPL